MNTSKESSKDKTAKVGRPPRGGPRPQRKHKPRPRSQPAPGWVGTDESGKGDYFGPLVIGGVYVSPKTETFLTNLKVRDSKKISDGVIKDMDFQIRSHCIYSVVVIGPEKYNLLYNKMKNLNKLLAWGHARVIENILLRVDCKKAISDQFGSEHFIQNALLKLGKQIELKQTPRAEEDLGVAAGSILARAEFVRRLERLSQECGFELPKGAAENVNQAARQVVEKMGTDALNRFVKLHFKNTGKVLQDFQTPAISEQAADAGEGLSAQNAGRTDNPELASGDAKSGAFPTH
jgi:ribonuclease HIII